MSKSRPALISIRENKVTKVSITVYPDTDTFPDEAQIEKVAGWIQLVSEIVKRHNETHKSQPNSDLQLLPGSAALPQMKNELSNQFPLTRV